MLKVRQVKAESLKEIKAGRPANCWSPGSGCNCETSPGAVGESNFAIWIACMETWDPPN